MKKLLAFALVLTFALSFAACGAAGDTEDPTTDAITTDAVIPTEAPTQAPADDTITEAPAGAVMNLADLVAEQNANSGGAYTVELDGKKLVYSFKDASGAMTADLAKTALSSIEQSYEGFVASWKTAGYDIDALVIQYVDQSGKVLASAEMK